MSGRPVYPYKQVAVDAVTAYARNARTHSAEQVAQIAASIQRFGFTNPILVDERGQLIAGHGRILAARELGMREVPAIVVSGLTPDEHAALVLADNKLALNAGWDVDLLKGELAALKDADFDLTLTGFSDEELATLLEPPAPIADDELPVGEAVAARTALGTVWAMGPHRLVCGDATSRAARAQALVGRAVGALVYDPPFDAAALIDGVDLDAYGASDVLVFGDCMYPTARRIHTSLPWRFGFVWDGVTRWIVPGHPLLAHKTCDWFSATGAYDHDVVKDPRVIDTAPQRGRNKRGAYELPADPRGKSLASVFRAPVTDESHGAAKHGKPVVWLAMLLGNCTRGLVFDPFAGTGAALVACERIGREWAGLELDPARCDVIVARWELETGRTAVRQAVEVAS